MPTVYNWYLAPSAGSGGTPTETEGVGTGIDGRRAYAVSRKMDPLTGDIVFDAARATWANGAPVTERVLRCLRTERGTAARDPSYGVDWTGVDNARTNVEAIAAQAVRVALQRFERRGDLVGLVVEAVVARTDAGARMDLRVQFADARGQKTTIMGEPR